MPVLRASKQAASVGSDTALVGGDGGEDVEPGGLAGRPGGGDKAEGACQREEDEQAGDRDGGGRDALGVEGGDERDAEASADEDAHEGAEQGEDNRLGLDHRADLAAVHTDGTQ